MNELENKLLEVKEQLSDLSEGLLRELITTLGDNPEAFESLKSCVELYRENEENGGSTRPTN